MYKYVFGIIMSNNENQNNNSNNSSNRQSITGNTNLVGVVFLINFDCILIIL